MRERADSLDIWERLRRMNKPGHVFRCGLHGVRAAGKEKRIAEEWTGHDSVPVLV